MLEEYFHSFPVLLVTGPRQCGKSTLLQTAFPQFPYITFDDPYEVMRAQGSPRSFLEQFESPVILDEIQYVPELFRYIKMAVDKNRYNGRFLLTGSQVFELSQLGGESLAGRMGILELGPLSGEEITASLGSQNLLKMVFGGGFPEIWGKNAEPKRWIPAYVSTYLERDLRNLSHVADLGAFSRFLRALALRTGSLLNYADLARDVGTAPNTAKNWVSLLVTSGLGFFVEGWSVNPSTRIVKSPKFYFCDSGLLSGLLGFQNENELKASPMLGGIWETWCFNQLRLWLANRGLWRRNIYYWRTKDGKEVDFLVDSGGLTAFECNGKEIPSASDTANLGKLKEHLKDGNLKQVVLTMSPGFIEKIPDTEACGDNGLHLSQIFSQALTST